MYRKVTSLLLAILCVLSAFACMQREQPGKTSAQIVAPETSQTDIVTAPTPTVTFTDPDLLEGFEWDPYLLYEDLSSDASLYASARIVIDALLECREYAEIESREHRLAIIDNIFFNFPPAALANFENDDQSGRIKISYITGKEEYLQKIEQFGSKIEEIISS